MCAVEDFFATLHVERTTEPAVFVSSLSLPLYFPLTPPPPPPHHTHTHTQLQLLRQEQLRLQEEIAEKNKLVRFQQLKIIDMRKALNKELVSLSLQPVLRH